MSVKSPDGVQVTLTAVKPSARTLDDHLLRTARTTPDRVALEWVGGAMSYAELAARATAAASEFAPGERVPLLLPAGPDFVVAFWAVQLAGAVAMPIDLRLNEAERAAQRATAPPRKMALTIAAQALRTADYLRKTDLAQ